MAINTNEWIVLGDTEFCSLDELRNVSGLTLQELAELIDSGILVSREDERAPAVFSLSCIAVVRTARKLRDDFELDSHGISLAMTLIRRIDELQHQLALAQLR